MRTMPALRLGRAIMASASVTSLFAVQACDPGEDPGVWSRGPTFLIVGEARTQPASPEDGSTVFIQARGGSFVSIATYGCKHRYASISEDATSSCAELPGSQPLYVIVKAIDHDCVVEARLYAECDPSQDAAASFGVCGPHDEFIESAILAVRPRVTARDGAPGDVGVEVDRADR
jgi:hypothetical protein